jgi:hypothetical protein
MQSIRTLAAAGVFALCTSALPPPALSADSHAHGHEAALATLQLDQGRKWATDDALRKGMASIRGSVQGAPAPLHKGTARPEAYADLGSRIEADVGRIVKDCKLPPAADAQLHLLIADVVAGADALKGATTAKAGQAGLVKVEAALRNYGKFFDHPGWK